MINDIELKIGVWNIRGMNTVDKQREVKNLISSEKLKICAILETRLKSKKLHKTCDKVFQGWEWTLNMQCCTKGCRITLGWDEQEVSIQVLNKTSQSMFWVICDDQYKIKCFYTFVYAANEGGDRRNLWKELHQNSRFVNGKPWGIAGTLM